MYEYQNPMMNRYNDGWSIFIMLFWVIFLIIIVMAVLRLLKNHEIVTNHKVDPLDIAKERYAKGEIKKDEFEQLKKDLK
jgi:putative membrane protein